MSTLTYPRYEFTPILGWSISRYEVFDKCRRQYFYQYYPRHVSDVPQYKMRLLRELTTVPLEVGNVVHDVLEALLQRLQRNDSDIDEQRFLSFASERTRAAFTTKTFLEARYVHQPVDMDAAQARVRTCLENFVGSPVYSWIYMKALRNKANWMIEPPGYGETRLNGLKAYCKMDFLFPADGEVAILDWKTGRKDPRKHRSQIVGYAAAASNSFAIAVDRIFPRMVYLYPQFDELEFRVSSEDVQAFLSRVAQETQQMYACCGNVQENLPLPIERFAQSPSPAVCANCNYQELCFPERRPGEQGQ